MAKQKKKSSIIKILVLTVFLLLAGASIIIYTYYQKIYSPAVVISKNNNYLFIPTGSNIEKVAEILYENGFVSSKSSFLWLAEIKKYHNKVKAGKYLLKNGMSNNELIDLLRSGKQVPIKFSTDFIRTKEELAGKASKIFESDSISFLNYFNMSEQIEKNYNISSKNLISLLIADTYEFYWNTSPKDFLDRLYKHYTEFWTTDRINKAKQNGLSKHEIHTLASIVEMEAIHNNEMSTIAGVYINRLNANMLLQADPTVIYAVGDFTIKRVNGAHLKTDSPYNTYKYKGLPPGPICVPSKTAIEATINFEKHKYFYFCAKDNLKGFHNFAENYNQHMINAKQYQKELNKRKI